MIFFSCPDCHSQSLTLLVDCTVAHEVANTEYREDTPVLVVTVKKGVVDAETTDRRFRCNDCHRTFYDSTLFIIEEK